MPRNWFLDFDDTLASGPTTWGLKEALPKLIREQALPFDVASYHAAVLDAQARVAQNPDLQPILNDLFDGQGWPRELQALLMTDMRNYRATLFEDALPFLERLASGGQTVYILSNNPTAPRLAEMLGIAPYIARYFTPQTCPGTQPKPHPSLWAYVVKEQTDINLENSVIVGDDPWSDGTFAEQCGLPFWIIDRDNRFGDVKFGGRYGRVTNLLDIPLES